MLLTLPFQWILLFQGLGLAVRPGHVLFFLFFAGCLCVPGLVAQIKQFLKTAAPFVLAFTAWMMWQTTALLWTHPPLAALSRLLSNWLYFIAFLFMAICVYSLSPAAFKKIVMYTVPASILLFLAAVYLVFFLQGDNLFLIIKNALVNAKTAQLQIGIYNRLFNSFSGPALQNSETIFTNSAYRHWLLGAFIIQLTLLQMVKTTLKSRFFKYIYRPCVLLITAIIFTSMSRRLILTLMFCLALGWTVRLLQLKQIKIGKHLAFFCIFAMATAVFSLLAYDAMTGLTEMLNQRFKDIGDDSRLLMYREALDSIEQNLWIGRGLAFKVAILGNKEFYVHNLFLYAWLSSGIVGLFFSVTFYILLLWSMAKTIMHSLSQPGWWRLDLSPAWVIVLPILPLLSALVAASGRFAMMEWSALAVYFALLAKNKNKSYA